MNIVLATRSAEHMSQSRTDRGRTRNGAGKSSLVDIVRFVLGGDIGRDSSVLDAPALRQDTFFLTFDVGAIPITSGRSPAAKSKIDIQGAFDDWPVQPDINQKTGAVTMTARAWNDLLGRTFFGLPPESQIEPKSNLSNNSCLAFFARRSRDGGFSHWVLTHRAQSAVRQASPLFFLLGLDPGVAIKFVRLEETRKAAAELKRAVDKGLLSKAVGSRGHLRNELVKARRRADRIRARLRGSDVVEFYGEYERDAAQLDTRINELTDSNYIDEQLIQDLLRATEDEAAPALPDVERLYSEANVVLPGVSLRRYEEVKAFHDAVVSNRKAHLTGEISAARSRIGVRNVERGRLVERHQRILDLLKSGVSVGHYRKLERELIEAEAEIAELSHRLDLAERFDSIRVDLKAEKADAERTLRNELEERRALVEDAIAVFQEISSAIYESPAEFDIASGPTGPKFSIKEASLLSEGIASMQIFTFDLTLATMSAKRGFWPGFLVHDSHIFDGVDGRQIGAALKVGHERALALGGQYIVTMNSDDLEKAHRESGEDFSNFVLEPVLSDTETGGLFGFPFEYDTSSAILNAPDEQSS